MELRPIELKAFFGGFTDDFQNGETNRGEVIENFLIQTDGDLRQRPPSEVVDTNHQSTVQPDGQTGSIIPFTEWTTEPLVRTKNKIYRQSAAVWAALTGPNSNQALIPSSSFTAASVACAEEYNKHIYITAVENPFSSSTAFFSPPMKIYKDTSNALQVRNMGLPKFDANDTSTTRAALLAKAITMANDLRTKMINHFGDVQSKTVTAVDAPSNTLTCNAHGLSVGSRVMFPTSAPSGITVGAYYYVKSATTNTFTLTDGAAGLETDITATDSTSRTMYASTHPDGVLVTSTTNGTDTFTVSGGHDLGLFNTIRFAAVTDTIPTGVSIGTDYYVKSIPNTTDFILMDSSCATINITADLVGVLVISPHSRGDHFRTFAAASTTEATLITLVNDLVTAYEEHVKDARNRGSQGDYHPISASQFFGNFKLPYYAKPTTLLECVPILNALVRHWNYHVDAFHTGTIFASQHYGKKKYASVGDPDALLSVQTNVDAKRINTQYSYPFTSTSYVGSATYPQYFDWSLMDLYNYIYFLSFALMNHVLDIAAAPVFGPFTEPAGTSGEHSFADYVSVVQYHRPATGIITTWTSTNYVGVGALTITQDGNTYYAMPSEHAAFILLFKTLFAFMNHIVNNTIHGGTESPSNSPTLTAAMLRQTADGGYLSAPDWTTVAGVQYITNILIDVSPKFQSHIGATPRHTSAGALFFDYSSLAPYSNDTYVTACDIASFEFSFIYKSKYTISGNIDFEDLSTPIYISTGPVINTMTTTSTSISSLNPVYFNWYGFASAAALSTSFNLPTSTYTIEAYRTVADGTVFYKINDLSFTTSAVKDTISDADLVNLPDLYTTGGISENDPPPKSVCFKIINGTGWYGGIIETIPSSSGTDTTVFHQGRLRQSKKGDIDSCPEDFYVDLDFPIKTIGEARSRPIVVTDRGAYRIDGTIDDTGSGELVPEKISDRVSGTGPNSGITVDDLFFFAAHDGFYICDGYSVRNISTHIRTSYLACVNTEAKKLQIQAAYDRKYNRIYWALEQGSVGCNDVIFVLDLPLKMDGAGGFTKILNDVNIRPSAIAFYNDTLYRGDQDGFLFKHTETLSAQTDPGINRTTHALTGSGVYVPWKFRSSAISADSEAVRKQFPIATFLFENLGNLSAFIYTINDIDTSHPKLSSTIHFRQEYNGVIREKRFLPAGTATNAGGGMRAVYKQIELSPNTAETGFANTERCHITNVSLFVTSDALTGVQQTGEI